MGGGCGEVALAAGVSPDQAIRLVTQARQRPLWQLALLARGIRRVESLREEVGMAAKKGKKKGGKKATKKGKKKGGKKRANGGGGGYGG